MDNDIFKTILDLREMQFEQIKTEWGYSSVKLKEYLNGDPSTQHIHGYAEDEFGIKVNRLLPYTKFKACMLKGDYAIHRLDLAMKGKAIIMLLNGELDNAQGQITYINECLHLFLRINSLETPQLKYKRFCAMVNKNYNEVVTAYNDYDKWGELINYIINKCEFYKSKRIPVLYHYKLEDFIYVRNCSSWKEAYETWINNYFDDILPRYKKSLLEEYKQELKVKAVSGLHYDSNKYLDLIKKREEKLNKIKITKLTYKSFIITIKRLKQQQSSNSRA